MAVKKRVAAKPAKPKSPWPQRLLVILAIAIGGGALVSFAYRWVTSPDIRLLIPEHSAHWIRENRPFDLRAWGPTDEVVFFRKEVKVPAGVDSADLTIRALRTFIVYWDKQQRFMAGDQNEWKVPHEVRLEHLTPGEHTLEVFVANSYGPAALLAFCDALDLRTGPGWNEHVMGEAWLPAIAVDDIQRPSFAQWLDSPLTALTKCLWWLAPLFLVLWGTTFWTVRQADETGLPRWWSASRTRWVVILAWFILAANNFRKVPDYAGYDVQGHIDYIVFLLDHHDLPDASHGWQMFQSPLFYMLAAVMDYGLSRFLAGATVLLSLRWLTLLCGIAQVELCFRGARYVFPKREDLQSLAVLLGSLLPMNIYMSQTLGNEPLCGLLTAMILLWGWRVLNETEPETETQTEPKSRRRVIGQYGVGLIFGLDMLTKMSALLMAPMMSLVLVMANRRRGLTATAAAFARCFATAAVVCGWYYVRNYLRFGKFLVGGWDRARGIVWWQDPGYRTPWQMISFGHSLTHPVHAGIYSIADGFYASLWMDGNLSGIDDRMKTPWNMTLMLAAAWPALVLSAAIAAGTLRGLWCRDRRLRQSLQVAGGSLLLFLAAFVLLWLEVPAYSQAKASYTLGLTPAYGVLAAAGLDLLPSNRIVRSAMIAFVLCWSVLVYGTYFVW